MRRKLGALCLSTDVASKQPATVQTWSPLRESGEQQNENFVRIMATRATPETQLQF
jgi:hypothetical protein